MNSENCPYCEWCEYSTMKVYPKDYCDVVVYTCNAFEGYGKIEEYTKPHSLIFNPRRKNENK